MYRERITITVDSDLLQAVDGLIDKELLRNRSQTIEHLLREGIGLSQLKQAFLFVDESFEESRLINLIKLCTEAKIETFYICVRASEQAIFAKVSELIAQQTQAEINLVPADFGSGGSVVLQKEHLNNPFLLIWTNTETSLPESLTPAYSFHRTHHLPLTYLLTKNEFSGIAIASPELVPFIPTGIIDLQSSTFPDLEKDGKVRAYLY